MLDWSSVLADMKVQASELVLDAKNGTSEQTTWVNVVIPAHVLTSINYVGK